MNPPSKIRWIVPLAALALAGCDPETNALDVTVQPDGSASIRVTHETAGTVVEADESDPERGPRAARRLMASWEGVTAWTDVSATAVERGRTRVEATAWLQSLDDLRTRGRHGFDVTLERDELEVRYRDPIQAGTDAIFLQDAGKVKAALAGPEAELEASIADVRRSIETFLFLWRFDLSIRMPGPVLASDGFVREADGRVVLHQDVETVLALAERHATAMREVRRQVIAGALTPEEGLVDLVRRAVEASAAEMPRVRCRLPAEPPPPALDARAGVAR